MAAKALRDQEHIVPIYREVPVLLKPPKRTIARALPSALHIGITSTLSVLCFGVINAAVTKGLGPQNYWSQLVQKGTLMAMVTVTILAMPNLGHSVNKGVQRICGVMAGGWIFFGLYAACQLWWFLAICLAVFAFLLVAASYALTSKQFLFPVALVTAFIVAISFNSVQQAFVMTLVKTVAISGAIVLYTLTSILLFPQTATQQVINALSDTLVDLQQLAEVVLLSGNTPSGATVPAAAGGSSYVAGAAAPAAAATKDAGFGSSSAAAAASKPGKRAAPVPSQGAVLAAKASHHLQQVLLLLPATRKERYIGSLGSYRCFLPSLRPQGINETLVMAVCVHASQVLRTLMSMAVEFGEVPLARRPPPSKFVDAAAQHLMAPLAEQGAAALQDLQEALPLNRPVNNSVPDTHLVQYASCLQQLVAATVGATADTQAAGAAAGAGGGGTSDFAVGPAGKWQQAAVAATGQTDLISRARAMSSQQMAVAFGQLLCDAVLKEEAQMAQWCNTLVLCRQLGKGLLGLRGSMNVLLPEVPGAHRALQARNDS